MAAAAANGGENYVNKAIFARGGHHAPGLLNRKRRIASYLRVYSARLRFDIHAPPSLPSSLLCQFES